MAYIIDTYNEYSKWDRSHSVYTFTINEQMYAIKRVELQWGIPQLPSHIDREVDPTSYFIYNSREEALDYIKQIKSLNR